MKNTPAMVVSIFDLTVAGKSDDSDMIGALKNRIAAKMRPGLDDDDSRTGDQRREVRALQALVA